MKRYIPAIVLALSCAPATLGAQQPAPATAEWNDARALELIERAQQRRAEAHADTGLVSYQADARAYVYFYLDREDTGERNLVKTDQVALKVAWQAPDLAKQRIVGWRDRKSLPTNIQYHIDHLAVVLENFGDEIRIGDGDEVGNVRHPASPGSEAFYDFRLADSLTLRLPGAPEPVRVYELQVRPRDPDQPAFLGSVFVEQRAGDLVRMDFTFTPSAYRDRYLDYINISLDNGLWKGRFWLPNQQRIEIRRQIPELDIPAGSVIRGVMRVGDYQFNTQIPPATFAGPPVTVAPAAERERFPFEEEIDAGLREQGIGPAAEMSDIRRQAAELARGRALTRLGGLRLQIPAASEIVRYNRAEGVAVAVGASAQLRPSLELRGRAGWAFGPSHPLGELRLARTDGPLRLGIAAYGNLPRDVGIGPTVSGALNSLSALVAGRDYLDPFYTSGVALQAAWSPAPLSTWSATLRAERHRSAEEEAGFSFLEGTSSFRPVRPVDDADVLTAELGLRRGAPAGIARGLSSEFSARAGLWDSRRSFWCDPPGFECGAPNDDPMSFVRAQAAVGWSRRWSMADALLEAEGAAGAAAGELPQQELFLLGGRGTVPGYRYRSFGGDRFALARTTVSADVLRPWLRVRGLAAAGWTGVADDRAERVRLWNAAPTGTVRPSIGAGVGIFYDILHADLVRGLGPDGRWELVVEARRSFWDFL